MALFMRIWRYLLAEPFNWVVCCFFGPTRFQRDIEIHGYFNGRRIVLILRACVLLFLCFFPLFCVAVGIENWAKELEVDTSTIFSLCIWFFLGCALLGVLGGVILGIARGITLTVAWTMAYTFAVLSTSLNLNGNTFLFIMLGFSVAGGILFGTAFGLSHDLLEDVAGSVVWTAGVFLLRICLVQSWDTSDLIFLAMVIGPGIGCLAWFATRNEKNAGGEKTVPKTLIWGNIWGLSITLPLGVLANASSNSTSSITGLALLSYALFGLITAAAYLLGYYRLILYPFSCFSLLRANVACRLRPARAFDLLHRCSLYWDECVFLPLPALKRMLCIAARQEHGRRRVIEELAFILDERPQQSTTAQAVLQELTISELETCRDMRTVSLAHKHLAALVLKETVLVDPQWIYPFNPFIDASHDADRSLHVRNHKAKQRFLHSMALSLRRVSQRAPFSDSGLNKRLDNVMRTWQAVVEQEQKRLEHIPFVVDQLDNPFSPGQVIKPDEGLFVGRNDLVQQLEEVLSRRDRRPTFLLSGESRMGKSSILHQLPVMLGPRYLPLFYDLQNAYMFSSTITFLMNVASEIYKAVRSRGIAIAKLEYARLQEAQQNNEATVYLRFAEWLQGVEKVLEREDKMLLLTFDEFEALAETGGMTYLHPGLLLNWFHGITQNHPCLALLFSGMRTFSDMGPEWAKSFVDVEILRVSFLPAADVRKLITQPDDPDFSAQHPFSEENVEEIIRITAGHPFMVQAVCAALIRMLNSERRSQVQGSDIETIIDQVFNSWHGYFQDQWHRADDLQKKCLAVLAHVGAGDLSSIAHSTGLDQQATRNALQHLLHRDLLLFEKGRYRVAMPLFCEWVKRNSSLAEMEIEAVPSHQRQGEYPDEVPDPVQASSEQSATATRPAVQQAPSSVMSVPSQSLVPSDVVGAALPLTGAAVEPRGGLVPRRALVGGVAGLALLGVGMAGLAWLTRPRTVPSSTQLQPGTLLYTYHRQSNKIRVLAWSPDNQRLAAGSDDYTVHVWDAATGKNPLIYAGHAWFVEGLAWSPDSKRIVSGSADTTVRIWNPSDGSLISTYRGHRQWVNRVSWSFDGQYIASGDQSGGGGRISQVRVWEAGTGKTITVYTSHTVGVFSVAWSPAGTVIASCGYDGALHVWDGMTGKLIALYRDNVANFGLSWSPDGRFIAVACNDSLVRIVDANTGLLSYTYRGHRGPAEDVSWSRDGASLASSGGDSTVQIFTAASGRPLFTYRAQPGPLAAVTWSPDKKFIASGSDSGTVQVWYANIN